MKNFLVLMLYCRVVLAVVPINSSQNLMMGGTYGEILRENVANEQQAFDAIQKELWSTQIAHRKSNNINKNYIITKRNSIGEMDSLFETKMEEFYKEMTLEKFYELTPSEQEDCLKKIQKDIAALKDDNAALKYEIDDLNKRIAGVSRSI